MWTSATRAVSYRLDNYFIGEEVSVAGAREWFDKMADAGVHPKIWAKDGGITLHYHGNHWVELSVGAPR